jgi:adenylosuccinate synthase
VAKRKAGRVVALVGAQNGSEGKGVVSYHMKDEFSVAVRTGAPNAGHSFVHKGKLFKMQTLPCPWPNRDCYLVLGPGALIHMKTLAAELEAAESVERGIRERVFVDYNAGILEPRHHEEEGGIHGEMHKRMGSTGEGVGPARRDRIMRDPSKFRLARHLTQEFNALGVELADTAWLVNDQIDRGHSVLLEGTQGSGLSLIHGPWPFVTSNDTNAAQLAADAGVAPQLVSEVILVARTYPIRVAGNSGPLTGELSWEEISRRVGRPVEERTTVTRKVRRIGQWDETLFENSVRLNRPTEIALTFMDYLDPKARGAEDIVKLSGDALDFVHYIERTYDVSVSLIGTDFTDTEGWTCIDRRGQRR